MRAAVLGLAVAASVAGARPAAAGAAAPPGDFAAQAALFGYDAKADLAVTEAGVENKSGVQVHDISFVAVPATQQRVKAFLVVPAGPGPFAGILWAHWLGEPQTSNRTQYLAEAESLAAKGVVSLLVDAMWSDPSWYESRVPEQDFENSVRQVVALRRAMDLLTRRPDVDPKRVGYVGHDFGGMYGMLAAGTDRRAKTYVFIAVAPSLSDWAFFAKQPKSKIEYLRQNAPLELTDYLRQVDNASTLFQFAKTDTYVSRAGTAVLLAAANAPKERRFYEADHAMNTPEIAQDRDAWLVKELAAPAK